MVVKKCEWCGQEFASERGRKMFCSKECRDRATAERRKAKRKGSPIFSGAYASFGAGWGALAAAIVGTAITDYKAALDILQKDGVSEKEEYYAQKTVAECQRFFKSGWFAELTNLDPKFVMKLVEDKSKKDAE